MLQMNACIYVLKGNIQQSDNNNKQEDRIEWCLLLMIQVNDK